MTFLYRTTFSFMKREAKGKFYPFDFKNGVANRAEFGYNVYEAGSNEIMTNYLDCEDWIPDCETKQPKYTATSESFELNWFGFEDSSAATLIAGGITFAVILTV